VPVLTNENISFLMGGKLCISCILHGSETWPDKKENKSAGWDENDLVDMWCWSTEWIMPALLVRHNNQMTAPCLSPSSNCKVDRFWKNISECVTFEKLDQASICRMHRGGNGNGEGESPAKSTRMSVEQPQQSLWRSPGQKKKTILVQLETRNCFWWTEFY